MSIQGKLAASGLPSLTIRGSRKSAALAGTTNPIKVLLKDYDGKILIATGTEVPTSTTSGYAKGCIFIDRDVAGGTTGVYENVGTTTSCTFNPIGTVTMVGAATAAEVAAVADLSTQVTTPGAGITAGVGTVFKTATVRFGDIYKTTIFIDLTGLASSTTADDIIGTAGVCHIGQITAAKNGTLFYGQITCLETPAGGDLDIDFWSATEGTGAFDALVTALDETIMRANGGNWAGAAATQIAFTNLPAANKYMYMAVGSAGGAPGTYTAGQFMIELWGF